jgi:hypothetical protein
MQSQDIAEDKLLTFARNIIDLPPKDIKELRSRIHDVLVSGLKYQKGQVVYYFDSGICPDVERCIIRDGNVDENEVAQYYLDTFGGRTIGWVREGLLFRTKDELVKYYEAVLHR